MHQVYLDKTSSGKTLEICLGPADQIGAVDRLEPLASCLPDQVALLPASLAPSAFTHTSDRQKNKDGMFETRTGSRDPARTGVGPGHSFRKSEGDFL